MATVVILAAGLGSRYGGLKQLDAVGPNGERILDYSLYDAWKAGFRRAVFVVRPEFESTFQREVVKRYEGRLECRTVQQTLDRLPPGYDAPTERRKPWGTGHAVLVARELLREPFLVINADDFYGREAFRRMGQFLTGVTGRRYAMVGFVLRNTLSEHGSVSRGICRHSDEMKLVEVIERTRVIQEGEEVYYLDEEDGVHRLQGDELASMNFWGFSPTFLPLLEREFRAFLQDAGKELDSEFYLPGVVNRLIRYGEADVTILRSEGEWFGMTYPQDREKAQRKIMQLILEGLYPKALWSHSG